MSEGSAEDASMKITLREIYQQNREQHLETQNELKEVATVLVEIQSGLGGIEGRTESLEKSRKEHETALQTTAVLLGQHALSLKLVGTVASIVLVATVGQFAVMFFGG